MICHLEWIKNDGISKFNAIKTPKQHEIKTVHRSFFSLSLKSLIPTLQQKSEQQKCATEKKTRSLL